LIQWKNCPEAFTYPHPDTPIEHILDFKSNEDNKGRLLQFRALLTKMSKSNYNEVELQEQIK